MTTFHFANLDAWVRKTEKRTNAVIRQSVNDMLNDIEVVPGINRGGSRVPGTIPRDTGALAASLQSTLYGSTSMTQQGAEGWILVVGSMRAGDIARFSWGGGVAPYAPHVHYGARGVPGTFWIDIATAKWQQYVASATQRAKAQVGGTA